jgi:SPP1 family predicted phage head-tail adaptor
MRTSQFNTRVMLQDAASVQDQDTGQEVPGWADTGLVMVAVRWGSGSERMEAAARGARQTATLTARSSPRTRAATSQSRFLMNGVAWPVVAKADIDRDVIAFTVERASDPDD